MGSPPEAMGYHGPSHPIIDAGSGDPSGKPRPPTTETMLGAGGIRTVGDPEKSIAMQLGLKWIK